MVIMCRIEANGRPQSARLDRTTEHSYEVATRALCPWRMLPVLRICA